MILFQHSIDFVDEPQLQKKRGKDDQWKTILVSVSEAYPLEESFPFKSHMIQISGREVRYHSQQCFSQLQRPFSWALEIVNVMTLIWDCNTQNIYYFRNREFTPELLRFWVFHTFFPIILELENIYRILHVGSVEIKNVPVLFSALSYGGKSTLTDYFIGKGHTLLSDDTLGIELRQDGSYYAIPSYPFHRPYREAESLGYPAPHFSIHPKPLHAVFVLEREEADAVVSIEELTGIEKFKAMHFTPYVDFVFTKQERFEYLAKMVRHVPVYRVHIPWDLKRLEEVYHAIVAKVSETVL